MKNKKLADALSQVDECYLQEALMPQKKHRPLWIGAVAAILTLVITASVFFSLSPGPGQGTQAGSNPYSTPPHTSTVSDWMRYNLAAPIYPTMVRIPLQSDYEADHNGYMAAQEAWRNSRKSQYNQPDGYAAGLSRFFSESIGQYLTGSENAAYSPLSVYLAMAMLAETADGNSRNQILELLGVDSIETLRVQANHVWNAHYCADGTADLLLGSSLWLDDSLAFRQNTVNSLANHYYASVFQGDLGSEEMNEALRRWLNSQTGEMLYDQIQNLSMDPETVFALSSSIFFSAQWQYPFSEKNTKEEVFRAESGAYKTPFMHTSTTGYYWGSNFGAIRLELSGDYWMWLILPDEGVTMQEVLSGNEYLQMTGNPSGWKNVRYNTIVNLSVPKFDVSSDMDLISGMQKMGITDVFDPSAADFSPLTATPWLSVSQIRHAARVAIDETGCIGAAYTIIQMATGVPPEDETDFILNRPFIFLITGQDALPVFVGTVTNP